MAMVRMKADKSQESAGFPVVDPGTYLLKIRDRKDGSTSQQSKNPGCQKVDLYIDILDPTSEEKLASCIQTVTFIPEGKPGHGMWLRVNHALGLPYDGEVDFDTADYIGQQAMGEIIVDVWQGIKRNKVKEWLVEGEEAPSSTGHPAASQAAGQDPKPRAKESEAEDLEKVPF